MRLVCSADREQEQEQEAVKVGQNGKSCPQGNLHTKAANTVISKV